jgi:hypothetical protein
MNIYMKSIIDLATLWLHIDKIYCWQIASAKIKYLLEMTFINVNFEM